MKFRNLFLAALLLALSPLAMAATSDTLNLVVGGNYAPAQYMGRIVGHPVTVDFAAHTTQTQNAYTNLLVVPAKSTVLGISAEVITAEGATCTVKVGTSAAGEGGYYSAALNLNSAAWTWLPASTAGGKAYSSAATIRLTHNHDTDKAKVKFVVWYLPNG